jgi:hypothetical protein
MSLAEFIPQAKQRERTYWCAFCLDSGFATLHTLANVNGERFRTWLATEALNAKKAGFFDAIQPATRRCTCSAGVIPDQKSAAGGDL